MRDRLKSLKVQYKTLKANRSASDQSESRPKQRRETKLIGGLRAKRYGPVLPHRVLCIQGCLMCCVHVGCTYSARVRVRRSIVSSRWNCTSSSKWASVQTKAISDCKRCSQPLPRPLYAKSSRLEHPSVSECVCVRVCLKYDVACS